MPICQSCRHRVPEVSDDYRRICAECRKPRRACPRCRELLTEEHFMGQPYCLECKREYQREWYYRRKARAAP